jgi:hypothetical protein
MCFTGCKKEAEFEIIRFTPRPTAYEFIPTETPDPMEGAVNQTAIKRFFEDFAKKTEHNVTVNSDAEESGSAYVAGCFIEIVNNDGLYFTVLGGKGEVDSNEMLEILMDIISLMDSRFTSEERQNTLNYIKSEGGKEEYTVARNVTLKSYSPNEDGYSKAVLYTPSY